VLIKLNHRLSMVARLRLVISPPIVSIYEHVGVPGPPVDMVSYGPDTTPVKSRTRTRFMGRASHFPLLALHT